MTAFQELVEMPLTGRGGSCAPADLDETVVRIHPDTRQGRRQLNDGTHSASSAMWGAASGVAALQGLRGRQAANAVVGVVHTGDVLLSTALGLCRPGEWSTQDLVVDVVDEYVQARATSMVFDRVLDPGRQG